MTLLIAGLILFLGVHSIAIVAPGARAVSGLAVYVVFIVRAHLRLFGVSPLG